VQGQLREVKSCSATSGVFVRYCSRQGSVVSLLQHRWKGEALAAVKLYRMELICAGQVYIVPRHFSVCNLIPIQSALKACSRLR